MNKKYEFWCWIITLLVSIEHFRICGNIIKIENIDRTCLYEIHRSRYNFCVFGYHFIETNIKPVLILILLDEDFNARV